MKPHIAVKHSLKRGPIVLGFALMLLTTLCYGQALDFGPPHNVIYSNGVDSSGNDAFPEIANSDYTDVIVNFLVVDSNCQLTSPPYVSPSDMQTLHNAGKTVLVSFGGADDVNQNTGEDYTSEAYQVCSRNVENLATQIANLVYANGFDGVDIDFEDNSAFSAGSAYDGVAFLTQLTDDLYSQLSQPRFVRQNIITHAPQTDYWLQNYNYQYPPYAQIYWNTAWSTKEIAWFNNQTYNSCLSAGGPGNGGVDCTAQDKVNNIMKIVNSWQVDSRRLVVGVPVSYCGTTVGDPPQCNGDGYLPWSSGDGNDMDTVILQLQQAYPNQFGGVMGWDFTLDSNQVDQGNSTWSEEMSGSLLEYQATWVGFDVQTKLCLDSNTNGNGYGNGYGSVYTDSCNGSNSQHWVFTENVIIDTQTGLCLDSNYNGNGKGSVYTDSCNGGNYQNWQFVGATIVNRQTGYCLDSDIYGNVYTDSCNTGNYQNWGPVID